MAKAVANLARAAQEVDIPALAKELKLPELEEKLKWHGPLRSSELPHFTAYYDPPQSDLGVSHVLIEWSVSTPPAQVFTHLEVQFFSGPCPSVNVKLLEKLIGSKVESTIHPGFDGGQSFTTNDLTVRQPDGNDVTVGLGDCGVSISRLRKL